MKLRFLGIRGNIENSTSNHKRHSSLKVAYYNHSVIIDCGEDWLDEVSNWNADAIIITHAHPDHAFGLKKGAPCPVFAPKEAWVGKEDFEIEQKRVMPKRKKTQIPEIGNHSIDITAYPVLHSTRAPAVGYRITAGVVSIFYVPDVAWIKDRNQALSGIKIYIGDGATIKRSMVRKPHDTIIGHVPIQTQLTWCQKTGVKRAIFTHLGSQIVEGKESEIVKKITEMAEKREVDKVTIARDDMRLTLR